MNKHSLVDFMDLSHFLGLDHFSGKQQFEGFFLGQVVFPVLCLEAADFAPKVFPPQINPGTHQTYLATPVLPTPV